MAAFELLAQALIGITAQSLAVLDSAVPLSQFRLLRTLDALGTVSCTTLASALGATNSSITRLVDKLEASGLVERGADAHSRSIVTLALTAAGRSVVAEVLDRRQVLLAQVLDAMSPGERERAAQAAARFAQLAGDAVAAGAHAVVAL